jgi:WD40 repeat protein
MDGSLRLTDDKGGEVARVALDGKYAFPTALTNTQDGTLISGHRDGTVQWRDAATGQELRRGDFHTNRVECVACDAAGGLVVSGGEDGFLVFWDAVAANARKKVKAHDGGVHGVATGPGGAVFSCGDDGAFVQWSADGERVRDVAIGGDKKPGLAAVAVLAGPGLVVAAGGGRLFCSRLADLAPAGEVVLPSAATALAAAPDGRTLAAGLADGTVALFTPAAAAPAPGKPK